MEIPIIGKTYKHHVGDAEFVVKTPTLSERLALQSIVSGMVSRAKGIDAGEMSVSENDLLSYSKGKVGIIKSCVLEVNGITYENGTKVEWDDDDVKDHILVSIGDDARNGLFDAIYEASALGEQEIKN